MVVMALWFTGLGLMVPLTGSQIGLVCGSLPASRRRLADRFFLGLLITTRLALFGMFLATMLLVGRSIVRAVF